MAEKPIECSECQKPGTIKYSEISLAGCNETLMCKDCPLWKQKLEEVGKESLPLSSTDHTAGICCGNCSTTLESVRMGALLGCSECYSVFADSLYADVYSKNPGKAVHTGRSPGEKQSINPTLRLYSLNEALQETLSREEYEEAAKIRDEIKLLMEDSDES